MALALQEPLQRLGAKRVEATLLAMLLEHGPQGTKDIVERTGLRQPEVSVGMQLLRNRGWVEAQSIPRQGKGRPMHRYQLVEDKSSIRAYYEELGQKKIARYNDAMRRLQDALS